MLPAGSLSTRDTRDQFVEDAEALRRQELAQGPVVCPVSMVSLGAWDCIRTPFLKGTCVEVLC